MTGTFAARERAAKSAAHGGGVRVTWSWHITSSSNDAAKAGAAPSTVIVVIWHWNKDEAAVAIRALLLAGLVAERIVDHLVVLVDAALHLLVMTAGEHRHCGGCDEGSGDLRGALHDWKSLTPNCRSVRLIV